jgi:hypothetical protein
MNTLLRPGQLQHCRPSGRDSRVALCRATELQTVHRLQTSQVHASAGKPVQLRSAVWAMLYNKQIASSVRMTRGRDMSPRCAKQIVGSGPILLWYRCGDLRAGDHKGLKAVAEAAAKGSTGVSLYRPWHVVDFHSALRTYKASYLRKVRQWFDRGGSVSTCIQAPLLISAAGN